MSNKRTFELSRRKVLGTLGTVGVASAGAGVGTSALLSDTETATGNQLVAGTLDLVVDFQEQYSDRGQDEFTAVSNAGGELRLVDPDNTTASDLDASELGIPSQENPLVVIDTDANSSTSGFRREPVTAFQEATAIDAFPDTDGSSDGSGGGTGTADDGVRDDIPINDDTGDNSAECNYLQPLVPNDGDILSAQARTQGKPNPNAGPNQQKTSKGEPLVDITDIKPGDFGEVTFSLHLCGNPGFISLTGDLVSGNSSLLNAAQGVIWYDTGSNGKFDDTDAEASEGDNILEESTEQVLKNPRNEIFRGDLDTVLSLLQSDPGIPLDGDLSSDFSEVIVAGDRSNIIKKPGDFSEKLTRADFSLGQQGVINCDVLEPDDDTNYQESVKLEGDELIDRIEDEDDDDGDDRRSTYDDVDDGTDGTVMELGNGEITITIEEAELDSDDEPDFVEISTDKPITGVIVKAGQNTNAYREQGGGVLDSVRFEGPNDPRSSTSTDGPEDKAISFIEICYEPAPGDPGGREPFPNSTTAFIGFAWYLPYDAGNEVANTSLSFDIGFLAEQARNNSDPTI